MSGVLVGVAWTDSAVALASIASAVGVALALGIAAFQLRHARMVRDDQTRPFVVLDLEPGTSNVLLDLVITNIGTTPAQDVTFVFSPAVQSGLDGQMGRQPIEDWAVIAEGVPWMPPGREIRMLFDRGPDRKQRKLPDSYDVEVRYLNISGKEFCDSQRIDIGWRWDMQKINVYTIHDLYKPLKSLGESLSAIEKKLPQLRD